MMHECSLGTLLKRNHLRLRKRRIELAKEPGMSLRQFDRAEPVKLAYLLRFAQCV